MSVHVFAGPSVPADVITATSPDAVVHPPVAHGDLLKLGLGSGDTVVIVDGYYHQRAPVRHKEILQLLDTGVVVIGCASMGALRAAELHSVGMIGFGVVFGMYRDGEIDADDEVAVAHLQDDVFTPTSTPLVNIRVAVRAATAADRLTAAQADKIVESARSLHYTDRTWPAIRAGLASGDDDAEAVDAVLAFLDEHPEHADAKRRDAVEALTQAAAIADRTDRGELDERSWRNELIYSWLVEFEGQLVDDRWVADGAVLRYHQVHSPDFPAIWQRFVLDRLGGHDEQVIRPDCVRAFIPVRGLYELRSFDPSLVHDTQAQHAVAAAGRINDATHWRPGVRLVDRLSTHRLEQHLRAVWQTSGDDPSGLLDAARDRGFPTVGDAVNAARPFFLMHEGRHADSTLVRGVTQ